MTILFPITEPITLRPVTLFLCLFARKKEVIKIQ